MATDPYGLMASGLPPELAAEMMGLKGKEAIAQALFKQSQGDIAPPEVKGRFQGAISPFQGLAKMAQAYVGSQGMKDATKAYSELGTKYQGVQNEAIDKVKSALYGKPAVPFVDEAANTFNQAGMDTAVQPVQGVDLATGKPMALASEAVSPADPNQRKQIIADAIMSRMPQMQKFGALEMKYDEAAQARKDRSEDQSLARQERFADAKTRQESDQAFRKQMAEQAALDRANLASQRIQEQAQAKLDAAKGKVDEAKQRMTVSLETLSDYYSELSRLGAAIDIRKGKASNLATGIAASDAGQYVGKMLGTEAQSWRNKINQMRPLLLNDIRQASQQGARGLDSNKELDFYLQAATDPARDIQANKAAIAVLDKAYGLGAGIKGIDENTIKSLSAEFKKSSGAVEGVAAPSGVDPKVWGVMTPEERKLWQK